MVGRPKGSKSTKKTVEKKETPKKKCVSCAKLKHLTNDFFVSNSRFDADGRVSTCKECLKKDLDINRINTVHDLLTELNRPYIHDLWLSALDEAKRKNSEPFGVYMKSVIFNHRDETWKHSVFDSSNKDQSDNINKIGSNYNTTKTEFIITDDIVDKWGDGYTPEEYRAFERKYSTLRNNYQEKTAMHTEALITYIRYRVKEELATANGDSKSAKEWGTLAKDAATAAKINPSQLSKSDLSDGLDTFGQLVRYVEQSEDIIPILPRFKERPQDRVDFTIWCYINYIRDLKGLPPASYDEIYQFYEQRKKEYEEMETQEEDDING